MTLRITESIDLLSSRISNEPDVFFSFLTNPSTHNYFRQALFIDLLHVYNKAYDVHTAVLYCNKDYGYNKDYAYNTDYVCIKNI